MKGLLSLLIFTSSAVFADSKIVSVSSQPSASRIEVVTQNAAAMLGDSANAQCPNGVHRLRNITFQYVNGASRLVKDETAQTQIVLGADNTVIATAIADCK